MDQVSHSQEMITGDSKNLAEEPRSTDEELNYLRIKIATIEDEHVRKSIETGFLETTSAHNTLIANITSLLEGSNESNNWIAKQLNEAIATV